MKTLKIFSWNVNGIRAAVRKGLIKWVNTAQPDILCIQETKAQGDDFPQEIKELEDYHLYFSSADKKGYAGTAVLTKIKPQNVSKKIGVAKFDKEGRFLFLEFEKFYLFNTYFPHSQRELIRLPFKKEFNRAYLDFIKKFQDKPLILAGDFNVAHRPIDLKNPKENEKNAGFTLEERKFVDELLELGFIDTFRYFHPREEKYTWWTYRFHARERNVGWRVDYFFVSRSLLKQIHKADIATNIMGSDHCPIILEIEN